MLEITTKKRRWPGVVAGVLLLTIVAIAGYVVLTILSPGMPVLSGRAENATAAKLEQPPGANGDRLYIPQLNVDLAIISGNDSNALNGGAWYKTPESGSPLEGGNTALSAHSYVWGFTPQQTAAKSPFYNLKKIAKGDRIYVDYKGVRYQYSVVENHSRDTKDLEAPTDQPQLTLYARTEDGSPDGRWVVEAQLSGQKTQGE